MKKTIIGLACTVLLGACASTAKPVAPETTAVAQAKPTTTGSAATSQTVNNSNSGTSNSNGIESQKKSIYFDFDEFAIKQEYQPAVSSHAKFLAGNPKVAIKIEGNADERGSGEYNLALGQKRAEAVRKALNAQGIPDKQIEAVSLGKEKPKAQGHDEEAWSMNRRADIVYP